MSTPPNSKTDNRVRRGQRWLFAICALLTVYSFARSQRGWSDVEFWYAGLEFCRDGDWAGIYDPSVNCWAMQGYSPVALYVMMYPLGALPKPAFRLFLAVAIVTSWLLGFWLLRRAAKTRPVIDDSASCSAIALGALLCQRFLSSDLMANQINSLTWIAACAGVGLILASSGIVACVLGGGLIAAAAGAKLFALALVAVLFLKRAWQPALISAFLALAVLFLLPRLALGPQQLADVRHVQAASTGKVLFQHEETPELWSLLNFLQYRIYVAPLWTGLDGFSPAAFRALCLGVVLAVGFPVALFLTAKPWAQTDGRRLWQDLALVGVALSIIDPVGRTAHFIMCVPAWCLIIEAEFAAAMEARYRLRILRWAALGVVLLTNNLLVVSLPGVDHHWYMHVGLFSMGQLTLFGLTWASAAGGSSSVVAGAPSLSERATQRRRAA